VAPKVHFLFGFQDRALEDEFREDLIECSRSRIFMGYGVSIFMILFGPTFQSLMTMDFLLFYSDWRVVLWNVLPVLFALLFLMAGLSFCIYAYMKFSEKRAVLHVTGLAYLLAIVSIGVDFGVGNRQWDAMYGVSSWSVKLVTYHLAPLISLTWLNLPFGMIAELMFAVTLIFLVIIPIVEGLWGLFSSSAIQPIIQEISEEVPAFKDLTLYCNGSLQMPDGRDFVLKNPCEVNIRLILVYPFLIICIIILAAMVLGYIGDRDSRRAFTNKKIMRAQKDKLIIAAKLREEFHLHKEDVVLDLFQYF